VGFPIQPKQEGEEMSWGFPIGDLKISIGDFYWDFMDLATNSMNIQTWLL